MKTTAIIIAAVAILTLAIVSGCTATSKTAHKAPAKSSKKVVSAVCPVMGNKIPDVTKASAKSTYKGKTYYFCCEGCKPKFDKDPEKYVK